MVDFAANNNKNKDYTAKPFTVQIALPPLIRLTVRAKTICVRIWSPVYCTWLSYHKVWGYSTHVKSHTLKNKH